MTGVPHGMSQCHGTLPQKRQTAKTGIELAPRMFTKARDPPGSQYRISGTYRPGATVDPLEGEIVDQNNRAQRQVTIIDDYLRLMYVAHEPTQG